MDRSDFGADFRVVTSASHTQNKSRPLQLQFGRDYSFDIATAGNAEFQLQTAGKKDRKKGIYLSTFRISDKSPLDSALKLASIFSMGQSHHFKLYT